MASNHYVVVDCYNKTIEFCALNKLRLRFVGETRNMIPTLVLGLRALSLLEHKCEGYLAYEMDAKDELEKIEGVRVVENFREVFSTELLGLPPDREIEFSIDLMPSTTPISQQPYRMAPAELMELKRQLQELLEKKFVRLSTSPWGAQILFVKKKDKSFRMCIDY